MKTIETNIERKFVINEYLRYDAFKKNKPLPNTENWWWHDPNALDIELCQHGYKHGILAGYLLWSKVSLTIEDFRKCAVVNSIAPEEKERRDLGYLEHTIELRPKEYHTWIDKIINCETFCENEPFILRRAVQNEYDAKWYLEDGSGRAAAIIAKAKEYQNKYGLEHPIAFGYLGTKPDLESYFMRSKFPSLLSTE